MVKKLNNIVEVKILFRFGKIFPVTRNALARDEHQQFYLLNYRGEERSGVKVERRQLTPVTAGQALRWFSEAFSDTLVRAT